MSEKALQSAIDDAPIGGTQLIILAVCFALNMVDGYDVLSMAFAAPPLADDWQLSPERLGILFSAGVLGMTIGAMFLSPLTDRFGRRPMILISVAVTGVAMLLTAYTGSLAEMVTLRIITGLGIGTILASLTALLSEFFPNSHRDLAVGINLAGYPMGAVLGGFLAAELIPSFGWQGVFLAGGVASLAMVPVAWFALPESVHFLMHRRPGDTLTRINRVLARLQVAPLDELPPPEREPSPPNVISLLESERRNATLLLWTGFFLNFGTLYFLLSWIPKLLVDSGLPLTQSIYAGVAFNLGGALGNAAIGWITQRLGAQRTVLAYALLAAAGMVAFSQFELKIAFLLLLTGIIGFFQQGSMTGYYVMAARSYPADIRSTGVGWGIGLGRFGAVVAPYLGGLLIAAGWTMDGLYLFYALPLLVVGYVATHLRLEH